MLIYETLQTVLPCFVLTVSWIANTMTW